jgi:NADH-quinone oxidoreductase subunit C
MTLTNQSVLEKLQAKFGEDIFNVGEPYGFLTFHTTRERVHELLEFCFQDEELNYMFLTSLCGMHYPQDKGKELGVVYQLHNLVANHRLRVKVYFPVEDPTVPTATDIWATANWMERETYDFFGILFEGHPDLRRILNVDEMDYFPMRKEIPLEDQNRDDKKDYMFGR